MTDVWAERLKAVQQLSLAWGAFAVSGAIIYGSYTLFIGEREQDRRDEEIQRQLIELQKGQTEQTKEVKDILQAILTEGRARDAR